MINGAFPIVSKKSLHNPFATPKPVSRQVEANSFSYNAAVTACERGSQLTMALALLQAGPRAGAGRIHTFWRARPKTQAERGAKDEACLRGL